MKRKYLNFCKVGLFFLVYVGFMFIFNVESWAGTLISLSSAVYDGGDTDSVHGIVSDGNNNIIITGRSFNGANWDYYTIKYDNNLVTIVSAAYDGGNSDEGWGVTTDGNNNIIVTGMSWNGANDDYYTIKYDNNLMVITSAAYDGGNSDEGRGVTTDGNNNIIVTGMSWNGANYDYYTIKYDNNLVVISSVAYDRGNSDEAYGVTTDGNNNIIVTGMSWNGLNDDYYTIKYDDNLMVITSAAYDGGGNDQTWGVTTDGNNNIIVPGRSWNGSNDDYLTIKYDNNLVVISSATYDGGNLDGLREATVDGNNNIIVTGHSRNGANWDYFTIKYLGPPQVFSLSPFFASPGEILDIIVNGLNFYNGADMIFSSTGITINSIDFISATQLRANITIDDNAFSGNRDITVTNIDEVSGILQSGFEIREYIGYQEEEDSRFVKLSPKIITPNGDGINDVANFIFENPNNETVEGTIFNLSGSVVRDNLTSSSTTSLTWDGRDSSGSCVSGKVYVYQIKVGGKVFNGTVVVAK